MGILFTAYKNEVETVALGSGAALNQITQTARERPILRAIERYSRDLPRRVTTSLAGNNTQYYAMSGLTSFVDGWSRVRSVRVCSTALTDYDESAATTVEFKVIDRGGTSYLYLPKVQPSTLYTLYVTYTVPYAWTPSTTKTATINQATHGFLVDDYIYQETPQDNSTSLWYKALDVHQATHRVATVPTPGSFDAYILMCDAPSVDFGAICTLAVSKVCRNLAVKYASLVDATIQADVVGRQPNSAAYDREADKFETDYKDYIQRAWNAMI